MKALYTLILMVSIFLSVFAKASTFWEDQQKGTNFFNLVETKERFTEAKKFGLSFVRLSPNKWMSTTSGRKNSGNNKNGNFLIGSKNNPTIIPPKEDIAQLIKVLDDAQQANIKVILTMISLPYSRWSQHNNGVEDRRIWESFKHQDEVIKFWVNLYSEIKDHPALVGINIRNEPSPERSRGGAGNESGAGDGAGGIVLQDWYHGNYPEWYESVRGTPQDLNLFNKKIVSAIRKVNKTIPIVLESGYFATPWAFKILEPIDGDENILYSFHMYEPYSYTSNQDKGSYPGKFEVGETNWEQNAKDNSTTNSSTNQQASINWNKQTLEDFFKPVKDFQSKYNIPNNRIIVSEFGIRRQNLGAKEYLEDLISIFNKNQWHWAFYSFREDNWDAMDYELGTKRPPYSYWQSIEKGEMPDYSKVKDKSLINVIKEGLKN